MFDYIVKKERLAEPEARHFFRQLVQAVAYIHSMGSIELNLNCVLFKTFRFCTQRPETGEPVAQPGVAAESDRFRPLCKAT